MKRILALLLAMLLVLSMAAATAETANGKTIIACPEGGFSTLVDFDLPTEWVDGEGLYIYAGTEGYMPYLLVGVDSSSSRYTDSSVFRDIIYPALEDTYGQYGGTSMQVFGDYTAGGRSVCACEFQFKLADGYRSWLLYVIDVREGCSVYYRLRSVDEADLAPLRGLLDAVIAGFQPDANYYSGNAPRAQFGDALSLYMTDLVGGGMVLGHAAVPEGWTVDTQAYVCGTGQSLENPWMLLATATNGADAAMSYNSARNYLEVLRWDGGTGHQDGSYNAQLHVPMLYYKDAAKYCDYLASQFAHGGVPTLVEENRYPEADAALRQKERTLYDLANANAGLANIHVDAVECSVCQRRYALDYQGIPSYLCFMAGVEAIQSTGGLGGIYVDTIISTISWEVPFCYSIICPQDRWDAYRPVFDQFVENTSVSDEFTAANDRLSRELIAILTGQISLSPGAAYSEDVMRQEAGSGDSYDGERFTDYLFDQNDYTLSDGTHVKVSTEYDYVYQLDNGNVLYTDSALYEPGGGTQLYPNR